ncbi:Lipid phosphate phosphatase-related protein type 3 [Acipenser ruthenus]|uniref:Lipid phosphate phosphatase-related protein type 3 n=1 Tax=Acipenser ruthenus TaxID=7906 RepID=A0A444UV16_ACIRT|nr:Lipid phosphate phosphatase-related protein type 3 [Acipenser ruthenus]
MVSLYFLELTDLLRPAQVGFRCHDRSLSMPYVDSGDELIPLLMLLSLAFAGPAASIMLGEGLVYCLQSRLKLRPRVEGSINAGGCNFNSFLRRTVRFVGVHVFGLCATALVTDVIQLATGYHAPFFLTVCKPNYTMPGVSCDSNPYITRDICAGSDQHAIVSARKTFPSQHATLSAFAAVYVSLPIVASSMVSLYFLELTDLLRPAQVGFRCHDRSLSMPYVDSGDELIPLLMLLSLAFAGPAASIMLGEGLVYCLQSRLKLRPRVEGSINAGGCNFNSFLRRTVRVKTLTSGLWYRPQPSVLAPVGVHVFGLCATALVTDVIQLATGYHAPFFLTVCKPNYTMPGVSCDSNPYITRDICAGSDQHAIVSARKTFPSQHATLSAFAAVYVSGSLVRPGFGFLRDGPSLGMLREMMVVIRIWGLLKPGCLPIYTATSDNQDSMSLLFRLLTKLWLCSRDENHPSEPDDSLIDECCLLPSQLLVPNMDWLPVNDGVVSKLQNKQPLRLQFGKPYSLPGLGSGAPVEIFSR